MLALFANPESIALILVRMMALVMTAPLLGHRVIPVRFRVLLGILLTVVAIPMVPSPESPGADRPDWLSAAVSEMTIGLSLGLGVMLVFSAARMVGGMISQLAAIPTTGQATEGSDTPLSHWFGLLSLAAFALLNGPELMVAAVLDTFADDICPEDVFLLNDPYVAGGNHLPDWVIARLIWITWPVTAVT